MSNVELKPGTRVVAKWHDGQFYRGRIQRHLRSGRYRIDYDDGDKGSVELTYIYVASSILAKITQKLERSNSMLEDVGFARDAARASLRKQWKDIVREREEIASGWERVARERREIRATESGEVIAGLRRALVESNAKIEGLEKLRGLSVPRLSDSNEVLHGDRT